MANIRTNGFPSAQTSHQDICFSWSFINSSYHSVFHNFTASIVQSVIFVKMKLTITTLAPVLAVLSFAGSALGSYKSDLNEVDRQIRNTVSLFSVAADTNNFGRLADFFTKEAVFTLVDPPATIVGAEKIAEAVRENTVDILRLSNVDTVAIDFFDKKHPNSTAYFAASFFGKSKEPNNTFAVVGKYEDKWAFEKDAWKIKERVAIFYVSRTLVRLRVYR